METLRGIELVARRKAAGYARDEFARLVGISPRTLEGWERESGKGVPSGKRELVEFVLSRPKEEMTSLNLMALLTARLAAGEQAAKRLAELEREHPEWFDQQEADRHTLTGEDGASPSADGHSLPTLSEASSGEDVSRGQQGMPPRRRVEGAVNDD